MTYSSHTDHTGRVGTHVHLPISHQELFFPTTTNLAVSGKNSELAKFRLLLKSSLNKEAPALSS